MSIAEPEPDEPDWHPQRLANRNAKRPVHPKKDWDYFVKAAWKARWWCQWKKKYIVLRPPGGGESTSLPSTPSGRRTWENYRKRLNRSGLDV